MSGACAGPVPSPCPVLLSPRVLALGAGCAQGCGQLLGQGEVLTRPGIYLLGQSARRLPAAVQVYGPVAGGGRECQLRLLGVLS